MSGEIDQSEMLMAMQSTVSATAKIYEVKNSPSLKELRRIAENIFDKVDKDHNDAFF